MAIPAEALPYHQPEPRTTGKSSLRVLKPRIPIGIGDPENHLYDSSKVGTESYPQLIRSVFDYILQKEKDHLRTKHVPDALSLARHNAMWKFLGVLDQFPTLGPRVSDEEIAQIVGRPLTAVQTLKALKHSQR